MMMKQQMSKITTTKDWHTRTYAYQQVGRRGC